MNAYPAFHRLSLLTGPDAASALWRARVTVFGLGGVGSWCAEALVRSGLGNISLVDFDRVDITNINRQVQATSATLGQLKTEALAERLKAISPDCAVTPLSLFYSARGNDDESGEKNAAAFGISGADYIIDAIDSLGSKLDLIESAARHNVTLYSSMGMARKLDPLGLRIADIWETRGCPLARNLREGLRKRGFTGRFTVVYSEEKMPLQHENAVYPHEDSPPLGSASAPGGKIINGSAVTVTASAGMILASLVIQDIRARCHPDTGQYYSDTRPDSAGTREP